MGNEKPSTMLSHGELPYPAGTFVEDTVHDRTGELVGVIEERAKGTGRVGSRTAFVRPRGGGIEWDVPLDSIHPVESPQVSRPSARP
ncbi:hypothetical protein [Streptomyces sp. NBC_00878]|uniref:hypothetical protein n=1 Tax=Streptomyces sp. NBC_00878 TaxID=2975854 RepID=UPI00225A3E7B|nr:hypothetical protein [Streptomyces sp. NBC_00878]MCX4906503.1 hypothetical protein [Streptomyces sp. NBC_00878]